MPELIWQPSLLGGDDLAFDVSLSGARRRFLGSGAWVDHVAAWATGTDGLFQELVATVPWEGRERPMYDRVVAEPRLHAEGWTDRPAVVSRMARCLTRHYGRRLSSVTANLYRDGNDSVAWHGDRIGRKHADTVVAVLSLGSARRFLLRPRGDGHSGGGSSIRFDLEPGDLLALGGTCQKTWEHCVPKRSWAGPRISLMFRERGVR